ncbi:MAG: SHOCT domain-containing protein [Sphingomonadales bacterium]|nr:SHOCT domain-containing protein [Sphingomonadales bacterium]
MLDTQWIGHEGTGHMGFMWIFWIFLFVILIVALRDISGTRKEGRKSPSALEVLEQRYARGEIEKDEFDQKRKDLQGY